MGFLKKTQRLLVIEVAVSFSHPLLSLPVVYADPENLNLDFSSTARKIGI